MYKVICFEDMYNYILVLFSLHCFTSMVSISLYLKYKKVQELLSNIYICKDIIIESNDIRKLPRDFYI